MTLLRPIYCAYHKKTKGNTHSSRERWVMCDVKAPLLKYIWRKWHNIFATRWRAAALGISRHLRVIMQQIVIRLTPTDWLLALFPTALGWAGGVPELQFSVISFIPYEPGPAQAFFLLKGSFPCHCCLFRDSDIGWWSPESDHIW